MITWVVGRGGLLGSAIVRTCEWTYDPGPVPWHDPDAARRALHEQARGLPAEAGDGPWRVVWAAGSATTSTSASDAFAELEPLQGLLTGIRSARPAGAGAVFLTSSAGAVYAGSVGPPFDATTRPAPLSPYGELKLAQEALAVDTLAGICPVVIGRVSNLYGPGQNLDKLQGLISRLALSAVTRQPINIFVSLDTIRDNIFIDDAAQAVLRATDRAIAASRSETTVIGSGQPATVGQLISTMNLVARRRVPVALGSHASASAQSLDLRVIPTHPLETITPLSAGMKAVYLDILGRLQASSRVG